MRKPAPWMHTVDTQLLELLQEEGNLTPRAASEDADTVRLDKPRSYVGERFRELADAGLVERVDRGLYRLTPEGERYLDGELDASELDR